ncbi:YunC family protein [Candidatus Endomicrobiellum devescovinae]|jgi:uncharacterized protein YunC (DUF1805 family)|uniref:YunC family protein n=1 Tax=Candidatus Endomicrobiellum devescovinae TaxID=3242322 RepID=UPI00282E3998|nr:DUF1805 domain-containing protein [Endomicrobium sp.]MDR1433538.1 DUF1805 domain-containing protein [Endomicrobium sp.]MDR2427360.1 DUF1805 domain-containing protein [Endomicrobium sp.]MDR2818807.1 DUF1805 domain-containing protein [Endomicrobium sp.]
MTVKEFLLNGKKYWGFEGEISPGSNLAFIKGGKGFIMCGYLNLETAEKMNNVAAVVTGVKTIDDMLNKNIVSSTTNAQKIGIVPGISVLKALEKIG